jgi:hypothetical protein
MAPMRTSPGATLFVMAERIVSPLAGRHPLSSSSEPPRRQHATDRVC